MAKVTLQTLLSDAQEPFKLQVGKLEDEENTLHEEKDEEVREAVQRGIAEALRPFLTPVFTILQATHADLQSRYDKLRSAYEGRAETWQESDEGRAVSDFLDDLEDWLAANPLDSLDAWLLSCADEWDHIRSGLLYQGTPYFSADLEELVSTLDTLIEE